MTHEERKRKTKQGFAEALKELLKTKPLNKITVTDLVKACNVNRKTFYYYFEDIYALIEWMLEEEAINVVKEFDLLVDFEEAALFVIDYIEQNDYMLKCAYDTLGQYELKRFLYNDFYELVIYAIHQIEAENGYEVDEDYEQMVCNFFMEAVAGVIIGRIMNPKRLEKKQAAQNLDTILYSSVKAALQAKSQ